MIRCTNISLIDNRDMLPWVSWPDPRVQWGNSWHVLQSLAGGMNEWRASCVQYADSEKA